MSDHIGPALNGNVLITLVDESCVKETGHCKGKVQMVTPSGGILHNYEFDKDGKPMLIMPIRVTQNYNSDVCVVNKYQIDINEFRGSICVFHEDGRLRFVYKGQGGVFFPTAVCCDLLCNIICGNYFHSTVHLISSEGAFLKYLFTSQTCVSQPVSLAFHSDVLWIGSTKGEVRLYKY